MQATATRILIKLVLKLMLGSGKGFLRLMRTFSESICILLTIPSSTIVWEDIKVSMLIQKLLDVKSMHTLNPTHATVSYDDHLNWVCDQINYTIQQIRQFTAE